MFTFNVEALTRYITPPRRRCLLYAQVCTEADHAHAWLASYQLGHDEIQAPADAVAGLALSSQPSSSSVSMHELAALEDSLLKVRACDAKSPGDCTKDRAVRVGRVGCAVLTRLVVLGAKHDVAVQRTDTAARGRPSLQPAPSRGGRELTATGIAVAVETGSVHHSAQLPGTQSVIQRLARACVADGRCRADDDDAGCVAGHVAGRR